MRLFETYPGAWWIASTGAWKPLGREAKGQRPKDESDFGATLSFLDEARERTLPGHS